MYLKNFFYRLTHWESWHYLAKYIPIMPVWAWYCARAGSLWFFTPSNPSISFGGFEGEKKSEIYAQLPLGSYPKSIYVNPDTAFEEVNSIAFRENFNFPFAVKPDAGMMGFLFRRINNSKEFQRYHEKMPVPYIIQEFVPYPLEVSVFYYRHPADMSGTITGFLKKEFLHVKGDGISDLLTLINNYERIRFRREEMKIKHADKLHLILPEDEVFILCYALNLSRGGRLISLEHEKNDDLVKVFDNLSLYTKHFYYGRYDIKCASVEDLKQGKNFSILEYNGCGAEPHHAYGNGNTLIQAYRIFLHHWKMLYRISSYNHRNGFPRWSFKKGWNYLRAGKKNFRLIRKLDTELIW